MTPIAPVARSGQNFSVADFGRFSDLGQFTFEAPEAPIKFEGKIFVKQVLDLTSSEISLTHIPPKAAVPFYHKHRLNEEIYVFVSGQGEFQVDGCVFPVGEGTIVRVDPEGERCMRNTSETEDLCLIVIQSRAGSYPDHTIQDGFAMQKPVSWVGNSKTV